MRQLIFVSTLGNSYSTIFLYKKRNGTLPLTKVKPAIKDLLNYSYQVRGFRGILYY
jgi:hypothetical protein